MADSAVLSRLATNVEPGKPNATKDGPHVVIARKIICLAFIRRFLHTSA